MGTQVSTEYLDVTQHSVHISTRSQSKTSFRIPLRNSLPAKYFSSKPFPSPAWKET
jgi:hypothetical protein